MTRTIPTSMLEAWRPEGFRTHFQGATSHRWLSTDTEAAYRERDNRYRPDSFDYRLNTRGFRCDEFGPTTAPRVVYIGCSLTMGIGLPLDEIWSRHVHGAVLREVSGDAPYWNLGCSGRSGGWMARMLATALPMLRPHLVVAFLPVASRREVWMQSGLGSYVPNTDSVPRSVAENVAELYPPPMQFYEMTRDVVMMNALCRVNGATFLWDTWDRLEFHPSEVAAMPDDAASAWFDFDFNFHISYRKARDGIHVGRESHTRCAERLAPKVIAALQGALT